MKLPVVRGFAVLGFAVQSFMRPDGYLVGLLITEWFDKVDDRITGQGRTIVSPDGKTLTITVDGSPLVRVYDRL